MTAMVLIPTFKYILVESNMSGLTHTSFVFCFLLSLLLLPFCLSLNLFLKHFFPVFCNFLNNHVSGLLRTKASYSIALVAKWAYNTN